MFIYTLTHTHTHKYIYICIYVYVHILDTDCACLQRLARFTDMWVCLNLNARHRSKRDTAFAAEDRHLKKRGTAVPKNLHTHGTFSSSSLSLLVGIAPFGPLLLLSPAGTMVVIIRGVSIKMQVFKSL